MPRIRPALSACLALMIVLYLPVTVRNYALPTPTPTPTATLRPTVTATPAPTATRTATPGPPPPPSCPITPGPGVQVGAWVSNANPPQNSDVTVYGCIANNGSALRSVPMHTVWEYKTTTAYCDATTAFNGVASCTRDISRATVGFRVDIDVSFTYAGATYRTTTSFTPR